MTNAAEALAATTWSRHWRLEPPMRSSVHGKVRHDVHWLWSEISPATWRRSDIERMVRPLWTYPTHATEEWDARAKSPLLYCFLRSRCPGCDEIAIRPGIPFLGVRLHPAMANLLDYVVLRGLLLGLIKFIAWKYGLS